MHKGKFLDFLIQKNIKPIESIIKIKFDEPCHVIGTIYKDMKLKPNILTKINSPAVYCNLKKI